MINQVRIVIENVTPRVDEGRFAVKCVVGDRIEVGADIWKDGHELLRAVVLYRHLGPDEVGPLAGEGARAVDVSRYTHEAPMTTSYEMNDRWIASFPVAEIGAHAFTVMAWTDRFGSWRQDVRKKMEARQEIAVDLDVGQGLVALTAAQAKGPDREALEAMLAELRQASATRRVELALSDELYELMTRCDLRPDPQTYPVELPLWADRERARYGAWYEIFPRSQGSTPGRSATFKEAERQLPRIAGMGFDVLYLTPIHPIGRTARRGPNNSEVCGPNDPGSPWAIGSEAGGHTAVHPELGTVADFEHYLKAARKYGLEIAIDFAVQCSPDHPWVKEHPQWFLHRPDGSIQYAENPPKKYKDIYPINFDTEDRDGLYQGLLDVVRFWIDRGVRIFRVDNPHTKAVSFWEWLIAMVHRSHPDVLFLSEAFTRPKRMRRLAKIGFTQSYTYFTWRTSRHEIEGYATELFLSDVCNYLRPNFFANTPDILHEILQTGGRAAFISRLVLAATLSPTYGIYNGFELCERMPLKPGSEEYLHSEKFEVKVWDWDRPGNITPIVAKVNQIRRDNRALQVGHNLVFLESTNPHLIAYAKTGLAPGELLVVVVNVDPFHAHEGTVRVPVELYEADSYRVTDLLTDAVYQWESEWNYVRLDPHQLPAHIVRVGS